MHFYALTPHSCPSGPGWEMLFAGTTSLLILFVYSTWMFTTYAFQNTLGSLFSFSPLQSRARRCEGGTFLALCALPPSQRWCRAALLLCEHVALLSQLLAYNWDLRREV